jgi:opacity protein-like surface antigen
MKHLFSKLFIRREYIYILFLGITYLAFADKTIAQESVSGSSLLKDMYYGGKFGTTISQFTNQQPHTSVKQGITLGGFAGFNFNDKMTVQLELNYLQEGSQLLSVEHSWDLSNSSWIEIKTDNQNVTLHNLDIPLMFKYSYPLGTSKIFVVVGPALGINFHSGIKHETTILTEIGSVSTYTGEENITSKIERYNVGITAGIGFEVPVFTSNYLLFDLRYRYGMMPVYKGYSYRGLPQITGDLQNNTMYITIGFGF